MNFSFSDDQTLLRNSVSGALDEQCTAARVRAMMDDPRGYDPALWGEMAKLGWLGLPFAEEYGGAGLGLVELCLVLEELGRVAYPGPYFSSVVLGGLGLLEGGSAAQKERWLPPWPPGRPCSPPPSSRNRSTGIRPRPRRRPLAAGTAGDSRA